MMNKADLCIIAVLNWASKKLLSGAVLVLLINNESVSMYAPFGLHELSGVM